MGLADEPRRTPVYCGTCGMLLMRGQESCSYDRWSGEKLVSYVLQCPARNVQRAPGLNEKHDQFMVCADGTWLVWDY